MTLGCSPTKATILTLKEARSWELISKLVVDYFCILASLEVYGNSHAPPVRFVSHLANALDFFLAAKFGNTLKQPGFIDLIGNFCDDYALPRALFFDMVLGFYNHLAADQFQNNFQFLLPPELFRLLGKSGPWIVCSQSFGFDFRGIEEYQQSVYHLVQVMGWYIGRHTHGNSRGAVDQ